MSWSIADSCRFKSLAASGRLFSELSRIAAACSLALAIAEGALAQDSPRPPQEAVPAEPVRQVIRGRVAAIVDGDTLHLVTGPATRVIELAGVDAPEKGQSFGNTAAQLLSLKVLEKEVDILVVGAAADRAILGIVYCGGCINTALVREGIAWHDERTCPSKALAQAQYEARAAARGLWAEKAPVAPWTWREQAAGLPATILPVKPTPTAPKVPTPGTGGLPRSEDYSHMFGAQTAQKANSRSTAEPPAVAGGSRWLTTSSGVRHNQACRYYGKSGGRPCGEDEGRPCKRCGG